MHKNFYASGFLYHPATAQILLQQVHQNDPFLSIFRGKNNNHETAEETFRRIMWAELGIHIRKTDITPVYDYFHESLKTYQYILYAETAYLLSDFRCKKNCLVSWFSFKQIPKLKLSEQTRQDIIVGQRVINLKERERLEQLSPKQI